jgi:PPP family 3-phenylpropionic acid transporter
LAHPSKDRGFVVVAVIYGALLAGAYGWTLMPRYLEGLGWSGEEIGALFSARKVCSTALLAAWAMLADRTGASRGLAIGQLALGAGALWLLASADQDALVWAGALAFACTAGCVLPLVDAIALSSFGAERYGSVRSAGTLGYGVAALTAAGVGGALGYTALSGAAPYAIASLVTLSMVVSLALPRPGADARPKAPASPRALWRIATRPDLMLILGMGALHWASQAPFNLFLVQLCEEKLAAPWVPGAAVAAGVGAEFVVLSRSEWLLARASPAALMVAAFAVSAVRWGLTAEATSGPAVVALQVAHGVSFGVFLVALIAAISARVPEELRASGQALLHLSVFGLGGLIGPYLAGWAYDRAGAAPIFWLASIGDLAITLPALLFWLRLRRAGLTTRS